MEAVYEIRDLVRIGKDILNPRFMVRIHDRGYVTAYKNENGWIEVFGWDRNVPENVGKVRSVYLEMSSDQEGESINYYGDEAEAIWSHFSAIAQPLFMEEEPALDTDP